MSEIHVAISRLLARREYASREIQEKLLRKGYAESDIAKALQDYQEKDWQSDQRFAEAYFNMRARRGYGPLRILPELAQRGIEKEMVTDLLDQTNWPQQLARIHQKYFKGNIPNTIQDQQKQMRFLLQRGFPQPLILALLKNKIREYED